MKPTGRRCTSACGPGPHDLSQPAEQRSHHRGAVMSWVTERSVFTVVARVCAIGAHSMEAQSSTFFREFNTPGMDWAAAVAADASGIYVIGNKPPSPGGQRHAGVRKYDSQGNELWTREFTVSAGS